LFAATDNRAAVPERVVFGFADRFLDLMKTRGGVTDPVRYGKTFTLTHDPLVWREAGDHLLAEAGAKVLFHSTVVDTLNDGEHVEGVVAWTKRGASTLRRLSPLMRAVTQTSLHLPASKPLSAAREMFRTQQ
jgi:hypothetical protein